MRKVNKVVRISLSGGIIGLLLTNPRRTLDNTIDKHNQDGWNAIYFTEHRTSNIFVLMLQYLVLFTTLFIWTFGAGYMVLFERDTAN